MREIVVAVNSQDKINLGYLGENNYQVVKFDITDWLREHENGKAVLLFKVNGMDDPYPCKVEIQGNYANWILTKADLQQGRNGKCQLIYYADGEAIAKSSIFCTDVANSLGEQTTEPPEAFTSWVNDVLIAGSQAENAVKSAVQIQQQMNETLLSAQQTFEAAVRQGLSSIEDAKEQVAQQAEQSVGRLDETADAANKTVLDALTEGLHQIDTAQTQAVMAVTDEGSRQAEKLRALVPDGYYTKEESDQRYAQMDNTSISQDTTWSSENIISRLCLPFTVEGVIVTCNPVEGSRLNTVVQIRPIQEGTGDPSPENIRPISGWDAVKIWRGGKNLIGGDLVSKPSPIGRPTDSWGYITETLPIGEYIWQAQFSGADTNAIYIYLNVLYEDGSISDAYYITTTEGSIYKDETISLEKPGKLFVYSAGNEGNMQETSLANLQKINLIIEPKSNSTNYEPYRGETFTIALGQMVYGGTLDVGRGVLMVEWIKSEIPNTSPIKILEGTISVDVGWNFPQKKIGLTNVISQAFKTVTIQSPVNSSIHYVCGRGENNYVTFGIPLQYADDMVGAGNYIRPLSPDIVYELDEPLTIQLTPQEIRALSGVNTVYADAGDVTVSGYSDPNAVITALADRIAALEQNAIGG